MTSGAARPGPTEDAGRFERFLDGLDHVGLRVAFLVTIALAMATALLAF